MKFILALVLSSCAPSLIVYSSMELDTKVHAGDEKEADLCGLVSNETVGRETAVVMLCPTPLVKIYIKR